LTVLVSWEASVSATEARRFIEVLCASPATPASLLAFRETVQTTPASGAHCPSGGSGLAVLAPVSSAAMVVSLATAGASDLPVRLSLRPGTEVPVPPPACPEADAAALAALRAI
jgi:hypothetical protein